MCFGDEDSKDEKSEKRSVEMMTISIEYLYEWQCNITEDGELVLTRNGSGVKEVIYLHPFGQEMVVTVRSISYESENPPPLGVKVEGEYCGLLESRWGTYSEIEITYPKHIQ
jgi:hypothetical protein